MPRHKPRSHLQHPLDSIVGPACGSNSDRILIRAQFLKASDRCQHCDRLVQGLKANTGGGGKKKGRKYSIVLSGLTPDALNWLEQLAAEGKAGETIGRLVNEKAEKIRRT